MMRPSRKALLWRLLTINLIVLAVAMALAAVLIGRLADSVFAGLMKEFHITVDVLHGRFTAALTRSLILTSLVAGVLGLVLSLVLFRRVTSPLRQMGAMAARIAAGDYSARVAVAARDEIGGLAAAMNRMAEGLHTLERLRKDLVANVAHELRTPLANLQGYLEAVQDGVAQPSRETIALLQEEVVRLVRLVEGLHELSVFDARVSRADRTDIDLGALVRRVVDLRRPDFAPRRIALHTGVMTVGTVRGDGDLLTQAVQNLLDNALKYSPEGGEVVITAHPDGPGVRVAVTNAGEGIAPQDLPFVFERFFRGEKSRSRDWGGAGIGLSIVQEVARAHGGDVGAESRNGRTTVWFTVPRA